ncbi:MAG: hypothetical protein IJ773_13305 [Lachnospiraceae bacterium]|nr:hypothetical protein [Lachnospiraceae bacterium]
MAVSLETKNAVRQILLDMGPYLDERQRRMLYGSAAVVLGRGGISFVNEVTGSARNTIAAGKAEIASTEEEELAVGGPGRVRRPGAGRKSARQKNPELYDKIEEIIRQNEEGTPLLWTTWGLRRIATELENYGITVSQNIVSRALGTLGYRKLQNQKMIQMGDLRLNKEEQFRFINQTAADFLKAGEPVLSVEMRSADEETAFVTISLADQAGKEGFEMVGASVARWWQCVGQPTFSSAKRLYVVCDRMGTDDSQDRLLKHALQELADTAQIEIHVSHLPVGTFRWKEIRHRLFCDFSGTKNGRMAADGLTVVNLIGLGQEVGEAGNGAARDDKASNYSSDIAATNSNLPVVFQPAPQTSEKDDTGSWKPGFSIEYIGTAEGWNYIIRPR